VPSPRPFTHLEVHSHFTLLGGAASVDALVARAAGEGMKRLALTDTNGLYGAVSFSRACRDADIAPVLGMALTVAAPQTGHTPAGGDGMPALADVRPAQLVLLATGPAGYRSLCRLSSLIQGSADREALARRGVPWEELAANREGLLCLSGRRGWIERHLRAGDRGAAHLEAGRLAGIFGDNAYLALEIHRAADHGVAAEVVTLGRRLGLRAVATQPIYYLDPADAPRLRLLAAIDRNCRLAEVPPDALPDDGDPAVSLAWLSAEAMAERFAGFEDAVAAAGDVAAACGPALPASRPIWPALKLPAGQTPDDALAELAETGRRAHYGPSPANEAQIDERLARELAAIRTHGYAPLFLVVADIVRFARQTGVPSSTRGSVANSLVAYCAGITTVDPIAHDLLFERFLNPARADVPDIDMDFCSRRRDEVLAYVRDTYGAAHVALVGTVSTMKPRSAVAETGKAYGLDEAAIRRLAAHVPHGWHPDPRRRDNRSVDDVLAEFDDERDREVIRAAYSIVGQPHHLSVHPGGVVITPGPLTDYVPVQWAPKGFLITQFDHADVEQIGLPKMDLLGISALTVLADAAELVRRDADPTFTLDAIPPDDPFTGDMLSRGDTIGVFQCESAGAQRTLRKLRARNVHDLAIANAFFKPGPATGGMAAAFVRRYRGEERPTYLHPALEPILGPTQGVLLFQEQILRLAREIAGLSWAEADHLRRGAGHFGGAEMAAMQSGFLAGCRRLPPDGPGFTQKQAETLWEQVAAFAGYGFNQGHATAYADVSYRSAYLKAHWPAAYMCARLMGWGGFHHPAIYMAEAQRLGIAVRPPHVNHSAAGFALGWKQITDQARTVVNWSEGRRPILYLGLGQVRDLRESAVLAIVEGRHDGPYAGLRDLLARVTLSLRTGLQPKEIAHLIQCGALDGLAASRAALLAEADEIHRAGSALQMAFTFEGPPVAAESPGQRLAWEQELLGLPISVHPLELVADKLPANPPSVPLSRLGEAPGRPVVVAGVRLPGWTGLDGFFLGDGETFITVKEPAGVKAPPTWQPVLIRGRWVGDNWGSFWLQAEKMQKIG
jgi:DNA polymerase-3 subunit alpha